MWSFKKKTRVPLPSAVSEEKSCSYSVVEYPKASSGKRYMCRYGSCFLQRSYPTNAIVILERFLGNTHATGFRTLEEAWAFIAEYKEQISAPAERVHRGR